jgi:hypothetical protein
MTPQWKYTFSSSFIPEYGKEVGFPKAFIASSRSLIYAAKDRPIGSLGNGLSQVPGTT